MTRQGTERRKERRWAEGARPSVHQPATDCVCVRAYELWLVKLKPSPASLAHYHNHPHTRLTLSLCFRRWFTGTIPVSLLFCSPFCNSHVGLTPLGTLMFYPDRFNTCRSYKTALVYRLAWGPALTTLPLCSFAAVQGKGNCYDSGDGGYRALKLNNFNGRLEQLNCAFKGRMLCPNGLLWLLPNWLVRPKSQTKRWIWKISRLILWPYAAPRFGQCPYRVKI